MLSIVLAVLAVCPSCKDGLARSDDWAMGFNTSIMFMMAMPFLVVVVVGGAIYRARRHPRLPPESGET